ncbi:CinA family protein [Microbulbifer flavimaris]|uniref:CinA family protein n=1 Tax=Microbulbifer flavimaris TaxID=1781068 RepID=A0ABX4HY55_9GAMM|nr:MULTISPECIES: CinA family protein [Microbulbifer]KUJ81669.1 damage-inducible protein CinA [Microbulbifer sp. ZGT114]PCO04585.1 CinA family protein [Microbulbifer flavimaris]
MSTDNLPQQIAERARALGEELEKRRWRVTTAESCSGGAIAAAITAVAGASHWFDGSVVSYANRIKRNLLSVSRKDLEELGAVSEEVVRQMASGVLGLMDANIAVAVSGVAGPDGGTDEKPVGTVWIALAHSEGQEPVDIDARCFHFDGDRAQVQGQTVAEALGMMLELVREHPV